MKKATKGTLVKAAAAGTAVAAAGAASAYYFYGAKDAKKHRKQAAAWMVKAEKEIKDQAGKLKAAALNEKNYKQIVGAVSKKYQALQKLDKKDVASFVKGLEAEWKGMKSAAAKSSAPAKKAVKKVVATAKKDVKKIVKKAAAKKAAPKKK